MCLLVGVVAFALGCAFGGALFFGCAVLVLLARRGDETVLSEALRMTNNRIDNLRDCHSEFAQDAMDRLNDLSVRMVEDGDDDEGRELWSR